MAAKLKIFFDTSLCIDAGNGKLSESPNWVYRAIRYYISPLTVYELVAGLDTGQGRYFNRNREAIRVVYPTGPKRFLPQLRSFIPKQLFGESVRLPHSVDVDFDLWIKAVLKARTREELESGKLKVGLKGRKGIGLDLRSINEQMRRIEDGFANLLTAFRKTGAPSLTPEIWAKLILDSMRTAVTPENVGTLLQRLDAAYRFEERMWGFITSPNYNFAKHRSELVDAHQLTYLCDPGLYMVTSDQRLKKAIAGSPQSTRVVTYNELKKHV